MTLVKTGLTAALVTALSAGSAYAGIAFQVQEGVAATGSNLLTSDWMDFSYKGVINQTIVGAFDGAGDTFVETGTMQVSSFKNAGLTVPAYLNSIGQYGIVGTFTATGNAAQVGLGIKAIFSTFSMSLYLDDDQDGVGDRLLGTGSQNAYSEANIFGGLANGDYDAQLLFTPTVLGNTYFVDPSPFVLNMEVAGNTTTISGASLTKSFVADVTGSGNVQVYNVPEPASLALMGLGLVGLGAMRRRASKA